MYRTIQKREPTTEFYNTLQKIYKVFNESLFNNQLSNCLISIQRQNGVMGYFSPNRFVNKDGSKTHEIALNPHYFAQKNIIEVLQTLVHEMAHLWQYEHGKPSRNNYHNKEWADKMESIGLMPSSTGRPGGKRTGQSMNDYPVQNGLFENKCLEIIESKTFIEWFDTNSIGDKLLEIEEGIENIRANMENMALYTPISSLIPNIKEEELQTAKKKTKTKYTCKCGFTLWGRPRLSIKCNNCNKDFKEE